MDMGARLDQWERQLRSLPFAIQAAEQRNLELTFRLEAQGIARYGKIRCTSSADGRIIPAHLWTPLNAGSRKLPALVWIHGGVHSHLTLCWVTMYGFPEPRGARGTPWVSWSILRPAC